MKIKTKSLNIRVNPKDLKLWKKCAKHDKMTLTFWIETHLNAMAGTMRSDGCR